MSTDLVSRLLTHLDSVEQVANAALPDAKVFEPGTGYQPPADAHIETWDPRSVLRLCQAHRQIVERYQRAWDRRNTGTADEQALRQMYAIAMIDVLSDLAHGLGVEVGTPAETVIQFTGEPNNFDEVCKFLGTQRHGHREEGYGPDAHMLLYTDEGEVRVGVSDWVVRRDDGSFGVLSEESVAGGLGVVEEDTDG
jgi:Family of unknown function (DUF6221)